MRLTPILLVSLVVFLNGSAHAGAVLYDGISSPTLSSYVPPGGAADVGGDTTTDMLAEDLIPSPGSQGLWVNEFQVVLANANPDAVRFEFNVGFWDNDPSSDAPGNYLAGYSYLLTLAGYQGGIVPLSIDGFAMPAGALWAGISFDDNYHTTGATAGQLNNLGVGLLPPPIVGQTSPNVFFTWDAGSFLGVNQPNGFPSYYGSDVALAWEIEAAPEPSTALLAAAGLGALLLRRRTRRAA